MIGRNREPFLETSKVAQGIAEGDIFVMIWHCPPAGYPDCKSPLFPPELYTRFPALLEISNDEIASMRDFGGAAMFYEWKDADPTGRTDNPQFSTVRWIGEDVAVRLRMEVHRRRVALGLSPQHPEKPPNTSGELRNLFDVAYALLSTQMEEFKRDVYSGGSYDVAEVLQAGFAFGYVASRLPGAPHIEDTDAIWHNAWNGFPALAKSFEALRDRKEHEK